MTRPSLEAPEASRAPALLRDVLRSDKELSAFCQDHFPHVHARFTASMGRDERARLLLTEVPPAELLSHLREFAPNAPAWGPQRRTWPYVLLAITLLIALVGGFLAWRMTMGRRVAEVGRPPLRVPSARVARS